MESASDHYYGNVMAVIKLRQNKRLRNVSNGVFRCILDYQLPKVFTKRLSDPYAPIEVHEVQQVRHFPSNDELDYDNYLVSVNEIGNSTRY